MPTSEREVLAEHMKIADFSVRDFKENARRNEAVIDTIISGLDA